MVWKYPKKYDVIVIGGGHAGSEAAHAAAKRGASTLLLTMNIQTIAQMSCNPSVGGIGKGHIVREIDALGGIIGKATESCGIQFRMLNTKKGPAVQAPRAQADKYAYANWVRHRLETTENLEIKQAVVEDFLVENDTIIGVSTKEQIYYYSESVILTSGTFMRGLIHIGDVNLKGGRAGEAPSTGLSAALERNGIILGRLKTGTPVRIHRRSIDFSLTEEQPGDPNVRFSFDPELSPRLKQVSCFITYTNDQTKKVIEENLHRSPLYSGKIEGVGPRYCPSIEDKVVRFSEKERHQLFLEPEGLQTEEFYVNGISSSLPNEVQYAFIKTVPALKNAEIMRPGYAIEYDYVISGQIKASLESKKIKNLFFAGQINGTTGYEEAAAQGLIAGINAVQNITKKDAIILKRSESYIGVMIDDLFTKGVDEPYRMFTSRAEHRLVLRHDNADLRLRPLGYSLGLISDEQIKRLKEKEKAIELEEKRLPTVWTVKNGKNASFAQLLSRPDMSYQDLLSEFPDKIVDYGLDTNRQIELTLKYAGYIERQNSEISRLQHIEKIKLPESIDYKQIIGLRSEAVERLSKMRPNNLGQASRIPGIAPSDISVLMVSLKR